MICGVNGLECIECNPCCGSRKENSNYKIKDVLETLGENSMVIAMEELAELQQAVSKGVRGKLDYANLAEEIADVEIILEWIKYKYEVCNEHVEKWKSFKKDRIVKRMNNDELY